MLVVSMCAMKKACNNRYNATVTTAKLPLLHQLAHHHHQHLVELGAPHHQMKIKLLLLQKLFNLCCKAGAVQ